MRRLHLQTRALRHGTAAVLATLALSTATAQAHRDPFVTLSVTGASNGVFPSAISGNSVITGSYIDSDNVNHGFFGTAGVTMSTFDAPDAADTAYEGTTPTAINASGVIAGFYDDGHLHGFVRAIDGTVAEFDVGSSTADTSPRAINNKGEITGTAGFGGFLRKPNGNVTQFSVSNAATTNPIAINAGGTIAGFYFDASNVTHGFVRAKDGKIATFDVPGGFDNVRVAGIDLAGDVAGEAWNNSAYVGFVRSAVDGSFAVFTVPECPSTFVSGMNYAGTVVGNCFSGDFTYHGFTRTSDGTITQYDGPDAGTGGAGTFPTAISANGKSVGYTEDNSGADHGYRLEKARQ